MTLEYEEVDKFADKAIDGLWISDLASVRENVESVNKNFDSVVSICQDRAEDLGGVDFTHCPLAETSRQVNRKLGGEKSYHVFEKAATTAYAALQRGDDVLVHCHAGVNRSAGLCVAIMAYESGESVHESLKRLEQSRRRVNPMDFTMMYASAWARGIRAEGHRDAVDSFVEVMDKQMKKRVQRMDDSSWFAGNY